MSLNLSDSTPAAPSGHVNVSWTKDASGNVSANIQTPEYSANKGAANGYAPLDSSSKVPTANLPAAALGGGTVTSVSIAATPSWLTGTVANSGTTPAITLAATSGLTANQFLATPNGSTGAATLRTIVQADLPAQPVDIPCSLVGKPGAGAIVLIFTATRTLTFPANFSGAYGTVGTNPTATAAYNVLKNGTSIGGVSISTSGVFTFTTASGATQSLAAGDRLTITAPSSQDVSLSDVGFSISGTR